ncbi:MAG: hypothetical protein QM703_10430 [Gemmatales bacterium]
MCRRIFLTAVLILSAGPVMAQSTMVALSGTAAASGGNYSSFGFPVLNSTGQVAFRAGLTGGSSTEGIFAGIPGRLRFCSSLYVL